MSLIISSRQTNNYYQFINGLLINVATFKSIIDLNFEVYLDLSVVVNFSISNFVNFAYVENDSGVVSIIKATINLDTYCYCYWDKMAINIATIIKWDGVCCFRSY